MKKWIAPEVQELSINETANGTAFYNEDSGGGNYIDLGTCNNPYWNGNGMSIEDAQKKLEDVYNPIISRMYASANPQGTDNANPNPFGNAADIFNGAGGPFANMGK